MFERVAWAKFDVRALDHGCSAVPPLLNQVGNHKQRVEHDAFGIDRWKATRMWWPTARWCFERWEIHRVPEWREEYRRGVGWRNSRASPAAAAAS
jgi:hypothetical protein